MRLGGRLQAAIDILADIETRHRPAADALKDWGLSHRFAGSGDRAAIGNFVYDALRRRRSAAMHLGEDSPRAAVLGAVLASGAETPDSLHTAFDGDRFAPEPLTAEERAAFDAFDGAALQPAVRADVPDWCIGELTRSFGDRWVEEAATLAARAPLDLRVNTLKADREKVLDALRKTGAKAAQLAPAGIRIPPANGHRRHPNVQAEPAFRKGWFEVQDEGSQIASLLAGAGGAGQLLDFCAGAGGKTLALSALFANKGQIFAHDADRHRLAPIFERLRRAGSRNVQIVETAGLEKLEGRVDTVLVDAPCTGSGTWRRRPDAKWRLSQPQLEARMGEQAAILDQAAAFVKPGGRLVYVTCSVFACENDDQVAAFAERISGFAPADHAALWDATLPGSAYRPQFGSTGMLLSPAATATDGFFISVLDRQG